MNAEEAKKIVEEKRPRSFMTVPPIYAKPEHAVKWLYVLTDPVRGRDFGLGDTEDQCWISGAEYLLAAERIQMEAQR